VTDSGLAHLAKLTSLEELKLPYGITDAGLVKLRDLTRMKHLRAQFRYAGGGLEPLRHMHSLETLILPKNTTDVDLAILDGMPAIKKLQVRSSLVTNQGMKHIESCRSLEYLHLITEGTTSSGLFHLRGLPIKKLYLRSCQVDEARLTPLLDLPQLQTLTIDSDSLRGDDLATIGKLTGLRLLTIRCKTVSDRGIAHLARLPSLKQLHMDGSATDSGLSHLVKLKELRYLEIHGDFSDRGLQQLERLKSLMYLSIYTHDEPSPAVLKSLRRKLPRLEGISVRPNSAPRTSFSGARGAVMEATTQAADDLPQIGTPAPSFTVSTLDGKRLSLEEQRGKVVILYFWSTSCGPCLASMPKLNQFNRQMRQKLVSGSFPKWPSIMASPARRCIS